MMPSHHASASPSAGILTGSLTDLRHAFRLLWKSKRITATTLVTLALCIGATTAIFSSVYALMLKPLPYQEPERIVELYSSAVKAGLNRMPANVPFYLDYSKNASSYESLGLWTFFYSLVGEKDSVVRTPGVRATAEIFTILRIQPLLGTFFTKEQNKQGADKVIVLTRSYWQSQYQESPEVLGKEVRIDDEAYKVIGVAPRELEAFDARMKFIVPLSWPPAAENPQGRYGVGTQLFGRLKPGVTAGQADAEAKVLEKRYVDAGPPPLKAFVERSGMTMNVGGVQEQRVQPVRATLLMLQGGVAFVLLIGCVNVANLMLVRSNARQSELAIRSALGAARATIARQFLMESLLLTSSAALFMGAADQRVHAGERYAAARCAAAGRIPSDRDARYAETLGLKLVEGRFYEEADLAPGRRLFVVDQSFARKFFPNGSAVGGKFAFGGRPAKPEEWPVIVGVVKDVPHNGVEEKSGNPFIYQLLQGGRPGGLTMFMRTNRPTGDAVSALRNKVRAIDPASPLFDVGVLQEAVDSSFDNRRAVMLLLTAFAALALFLSALGIYGVLAYDVSQRTREIGVRSAIGASRGQIVGLILRQGLWKGGIGVVLGLIGAALLSRSMTTLLFNVPPTDPAVYASVSFVLIAVALLASYLPARRASRIDPLIALRDE